MAKRTKEQNRRQKQVDRENNPIKNAYRYNKSKHGIAWKISQPFFKAWALMKGWKEKRGNRKDDYCISRRDFGDDFTEDNITLRKRSEHNSMARKHGHKKNEDDDGSFW